MTTLLLDGNIYNKLRDDLEARTALADRVQAGEVRVFATPIVIDELNESPFRGIPNCFHVDLEPESVVVLGYARFGMARLGNGEVFAAHRGASKKTKDAIMADSADSLADLFVSEDSRCRKRLSQTSTKCRALSWFEFRQWLFSGK